MSATDALRIYLAARAELIRYATRLTNDPAAAEDVVQDAWLRFRATAASRVLDEPKGYLFRIIQNLVMDRQRRRGLEGRIFVTDSTAAATAVASDQPSQHASAEARDELALLHEAMAKLPERSRRALEMHRFEEMKLVDIAEELGISKSLASELVIDAVEYCKKALRRRH